MELCSGLSLIASRFLSFILPLLLFNMTELATLANPTVAITTSASRRSWLKGLGALFGSGLLAAPTTLLASPAAVVGNNSNASAASAAAGGNEYIGMVKLLTGSTVPAGWALCEGQHLPTDQHPALFAVLRATYGGDGRHTFALPDMRADMAAMRALAAGRAADAVPMGQLCVIKVANAPALATAGAELRLHHQRRAQPVRG
jgi:hypothetical protein